MTKSKGKMKSVDTAEVIEAKRKERAAKKALMSGSLGLIEGNSGQVSVTNKSDPDSSLRPPGPILLICNDPNESKSIKPEFIWKYQSAQTFFRDYNLWPSFIGSKIVNDDASKGNLPILVWPEQKKYLEKKVVNSKKRKRNLNEDELPPSKKLNSTYFDSAKKMFIKFYDSILSLIGFSYTRSSY
jgi:hypothetical protein